MQFLCDAFAFFFAGALRLANGFCRGERRARAIFRRRPAKMRPHTVDRKAVAFGERQTGAQRSQQRLRGLALGARGLEARHPLLLFSNEAGGEFDRATGYERISAPGRGGRCLARAVVVGRVHTMS